MKEEKYLDAVIELIKTDGLGLSMDAIADGIGVTRKTLYNRFSSKDELMEKCMERLFQEFRGLTACLDDSSVPVEQGFRDGILGMWQFFRDASHVFTRDLMENYPGIANDRHNSGTELFEERLRGNILRGQEQGVYRTEIDAGLMARFVAYSIFSFFHKEVMKGGVCTYEEYFSQVIDFNLKALLL
ncbi:MAG: TetR/AcrR family transcriptional regulator [Bacteroidaceae bacterium]|nr:TetR/AcrR family transcriptional regulator [Bacteroidaceae bacterium]